MPRDLRALPKAHLHLHLEGCARPSTAGEIAARQGQALAFGRCDGWDDFFVKMSSLSLCLSSLDDVVRMIRELAEDEAAQGVAYAEPMVNPFFYAPRFGAVDDVFAAMREAARDAAEATGVELGLMLVALRDLPPEWAEDQARFAAEHAGDGLVAFGLAGSEHRAPPEPFAKAFAIAGEAGLRLVPHAGELAGAESVAATLDHLAPHRIAHGVRAVEDESVLARLADAGVACDVCPTSNVQLRVVPDLASHPLPRMLEAGVPVTLNADDSLFFGAGILDEYEQARAVLGLVDEELAAIARTSGDASGASAATVARMHEGIDAWLAGPA